MSNMTTHPLIVESRRNSAATLEKRHPGAEIIDVTSRGEEPWVRFSPFYPHGAVPVPLSSALTGASVEGIWQALKVFEMCDVDLSKLSVTSMKGIKRSARTDGRVLGHRVGVEISGAGIVVSGAESCTRLLSYLDARLQIYLPAYLWVLENRLTNELAALRKLAETVPVVLLDYETNCDVHNLSKPLSHAGLIKLYLQGAYPRL